MLWWLSLVARILRGRWLLIRILLYGHRKSRLTGVCRALSTCRADGTADIAGKSYRASMHWARHGLGQRLWSKLLRDPVPRAGQGYMTRRSSASVVMLLWR